MVTITAANFEEILKSDKPVLIDFWATWCGPCMMMGPILEEFAAEHPEILVGKVNVDEESELAMAAKIQSIPTLIAIRDGQVINAAVGVQQKEQLAAMFA